jgi:hypothetical protein
MTIDNCDFFWVLRSLKTEYLVSDLWIQATHTEHRSRNNFFTSGSMVLVIIKLCSDSNGIEAISYNDVGNTSMKDLYICNACWLVATPRSIVKGSSLTEAFLWGLFLIPGILYSTWRFMTKEKVCPVCSSLAVIPINSVMGRKLLDRIYSNRSTTFVKRPLNYEYCNFIKEAHQKHEEHFQVRKNPDTRGHHTGV